MMKTELQKTFTWKIDNFSEINYPIKSTMFSSGGCEWYAIIHPKGDDVDDHLSLYLCVGNPKSLRPGWKRRVSMGFVIFNQSGKVLHTTSEGSNLFRAEIPGWGFRKAVPLNKLQDKEFLENNTLVIEVYTKVSEVVHQGDETGKEMLDIGGFQVLSYQVIPVSRIFAKYPNFAVSIRTKSKAVKTAYMNVLLGLIETLNKPPESLSETALINAYSELSDLTEVGFKLDWLKSKLDEVSLDRKKEKADAARVQELEENVKNLEFMLSDLKIELKKEKAKSETDSKVFSLKDDVSLRETNSLRNRQRRSVHGKKD